MASSAPLSTVVTPVSKQSAAMPVCTTLSRPCFSTAILGGWRLRIRSSIRRPVARLRSTRWDVKMEELIRSQKYDELAEYCEEEELKVCRT